MTLKDIFQTRSRFNETYFRPILKRLNIPETPCKTSSKFESVLKSLEKRSVGLEFGRLKPVRNKRKHAYNTFEESLKHPCKKEGLKRHEPI